MSDLALLTAAFVCAVCGMAWLALAMKPHWAQVRSATSHTAAVARRLRGAGAVALLLSLAASLGADHPSMALLVWVMMLSVSAVIVAMTLAYWPKCLLWLSWLPDGSGKPTGLIDGGSVWQSGRMTRARSSFPSGSTHG
ncbi:DUF3325 domain-containing protein [Sorangium sp. So ce1335]|uniref:DUF3325 domain-containing protein n=1 Tax=Sorangium sp. So ce1335 TaxID=3133335 RepID=UPI003F624D34